MQGIHASMRRVYPRLESPSPHLAQSAANRTAKMKERILCKKLSDWSRCKCRWDYWGLNWKWVLQVLKRGRCCRRDDCSAPQQPF